MRDNQKLENQPSRKQKFRKEFHLRISVLAWVLAVFGSLGFLLQLLLVFQTPDAKSLAVEQFLFEVNSRQTYLSMCLFSGLTGLGLLFLGRLAKAKKIQNMFLIVLSGLLVFILSLVFALFISSSISDSATLKSEQVIKSSGLVHCSTVSIFSKRHLGGRGGSFPRARTVKVYQKDCTQFTLDFKDDPYRRSVVMPLSEQHIQADHKELGLPLYALCASRPVSWMDVFSSVSEYKWELLEQATFNTRCDKAKGPTTQ